jgi:hypothetical protein
VTAQFDRSPRDGDIHNSARRPRVPTLLGVLCLIGGLATFAGGQVVKAASLSPTTITSSVEQTHANVGDHLSDTASLANTTTLDGSGFIKFTLYAPGDTTCSTPVGTDLEGDITSDGPISSEAGFFIASEAGVYQWIAAFTGDLGNSPATTACGDEPVTVTPDTTISTVASPSAGAPGTRLQDTATLTDTSTLTGTGSILFSLYAPDTFCAVLLYTETVADVTSDGPLSTTVGYSANVAGTYEWTAAFSGDANNTPAATQCGDEPVVITAHPSISTTAEPDSGPVGTTLNDLATLSGAADLNGSGSVSIELYGPGDPGCTNPLLNDTFILVTSDGPFETLIFAHQYVATVPGIYQWTASFSGDGNNTAASTACGDEPVAVGGNPTMTATAAPAATTTGSRLQDSALLASTESLQGTGAITFNLYGPGDTTCATIIHTETVTGVASDGPFGTSAGFVATLAGTYNWTASFTGDADNAPATSSCGADPVVVTKSPTSQITPASATCTQFAGGTAASLSDITYSMKGGKVTSASPGFFDYWLKVTSTGGTQTVPITQFTNETSRPFLKASGGGIFSATCANAPGAITQSGGVATARFNGGSAGTVWYIEIRFSTTHVIGESSPRPSTSVLYLIRARGTTTQVDFIR